MPEQSISPILSSPASAAIHGQVYAPSEAERRFQESIRQWQAPGVQEWFDAAIRTDWLAFKPFNGESYLGQPDPSFSMSEDFFKQLTDGLPSEFDDEFDDIYSHQHGLFIRDKMQRRLRDEETIMSLGWPAIPARMLVGMVDPVNLAAMAASEGLAAPLVWGAKISRMQRFLRNGLVVGGETGAYMSVLAASDPLVDTDDVMIATLFGGLLGGGLGALKAGDVADAYKGVQKGQIEKSGAKLTPKGEAHYDHPKWVLNPALREIDDLRESGVITAAQAKRWKRKLNKAVRRKEFETAEEALVETRPSSITRETVPYREATAQARRSARIEADKVVGDTVHVEGMGMGQVFAERIKDGVRQLRVIVEEAVDSRIPRVIDRRMDFSKAAREIDQYDQAERAVINKRFKGKPKQLAEAKQELENTLNGMRRDMADAAKTQRLDPAIAGASRKWVKAEAISQGVARHSDGKWRTIEEMRWLLKSSSEQMGMKPRPFRTKRWVNADEVELLGADKFADDLDSADFGQLQRLAKERGIKPTIKGLAKKSKAELVKIAETIGLSRPGKRITRQQLLALIRNNDLKSAIRNHEFDRYLHPALREAGEKTPAKLAAEAAEEVAAKEPVTTQAILDAFSDTSWLALEWLRKMPVMQSLTARFGRRVNPVVRWFGQQVFADPLAREGGNSTAVVSFEEYVRNADRRIRTATVRSTESQFREWFRQSGMSWTSRPKARREFYRLAGRAVRSTEQVTDPHIAKAVEEIRGFFKTMLKEAKEAGVKGADNIDIDDNFTYIPRFWDLANLDVMRVKNAGALQKLMTLSIRRATPELTEEEAGGVARALINTLHRQHTEPALGRLSVIPSTRDVDQLRTMLTELGEDISEQNIESILKKMKPNEDTPIGRFKDRVPLDEATEIVEDGVTYRIDDLMENDANFLMGAYSRQVHGAVAVKKLIGNYNAKAGTAYDTLEDIIDDIKRTNKAMLDSGELTSAELKNSLQDIDLAYRILKGVPLNPNTKMHEVSRLVRDWNFATTGGTFGFAQVAELGNLMGAVTYGVFFRAMPSMRHMMKRMADGTLSDVVQRDLEWLTGIGNDRLLHQMTGHQGMDAMMDNFPRWRKIRELAVDATRHVADIGGFNLIDMSLRKSAAELILQRFVFEAMEGTDGSFFKVKRIGKVRLDQLGVTEEMFERVKVMLRKHAQTEPNGKLQRKTLNFEAWEDQEAVAALAVGINKFVARTIQEPFLGDLAPWMTKDLARMFIQFRTFTIGAWNRQLAAGVQANDTEMYMSWIGSMFFGGLSYAVQSSIRYGGDPEELAEKLSMGELAKASVTRAGFTSYAPTMLDSAGYLFGFDPMFQNQRTSGLAMNITGNPTFSKIEDIVKAARGGLRVPQGEANGWDFKAVTNLLPGRNVPVISNMLQATADSIGYSTK